MKVNKKFTNKTFAYTKNKIISASLLIITSLVTFVPVPKYNVLFCLMQYLSDGKPMIFQYAALVLLFAMPVTAVVLLLPKFKIYQYDSIFAKSVFIFFLSLFATLISDMLFGLISADASGAKPNLTGIYNEYFRVVEIYTLCTSTQYFMLTEAIFMLLFGFLIMIPDIRHDNDKSSRLPYYSLIQGLLAVFLISLHKYIIVLKVLFSISAFICGVIGLINDGSYKAQLMAKCGISLSVSFVAVFALNVLFVVIL